MDLDELAEKENENWVYKGSSYNYPQNNRCIISLSRGGGDAIVKREFDIASRTFVEDGFYLPEAKSSMKWLDNDHVAVGDVVSQSPGFGIVF